MARRTFFSFHYNPDVWRAWNVRNSWVVKDKTEDRGFFDSSVFEAAKKESDDALKRFLREGLENTSVTCVLAGTDTWSRRWVRYEIARSVLKKNGLLTVHIHGVQDKDKKTATKGKNPLDYIGLYKSNDKIYLAEYNGTKWVSYSDYTVAIPSADFWFPDPTTKVPVPLSKHCKTYDYVAEKGRENLPDWIEVAAKQAGR